MGALAVAVPSTDQAGIRLVPALSSVVSFLFYRREGQEGTRTFFLTHGKRKKNNKAVFPFLTVVW